MIMRTTHVLGTINHINQLKKARDMQEIKMLFPPSHVFGWDGVRIQLALRSLNRCHVRIVSPMPKPGGRETLVGIVGDMTLYWVETDQT